MNSQDWNAKTNYLIWNRITQVSSYVVAASFVLTILLTFFQLQYIPGKNGMWRVELGDRFPDELAWLEYVMLFLVLFSFAAALFFVTGAVMRFIFRRKLGLSARRIEIGIPQATEFLSWYYFVSNVLYAVFPADAYLFGKAETPWGALWQMADPLLIILLALLYFRSNLALMSWGKFIRPAANLLELSGGFLILFFLLQPALDHILQHWFHLSTESFRNEMIADWVKEAKETGIRSLILQFLSLAVITPVAEEILCRGVVHRAIANRYGVLAGTLLSALFFTVLHVDPVAALPIFAFSLFLSYVYERSKSLWAPILLHSVNNAIYVTLTLVQ